MADDSNDSDKDIDLLELTAHIVSAYVEKNRLPVAGLSERISTVRPTMGADAQPPAPEAPPQIPAV